MSQIEDGSYVIIDGTRARFIDHDIIETIEDFMAGANDSQIRIELKNLAGLSPKLQAEPST